MVYFGRIFDRSDINLVIDELLPRPGEPIFTKSFVLHAYWLVFKAIQSSWWLLSRTVLLPNDDFPMNSPLNASHHYDNKYTPTMIPFYDTPSLGRYVDANLYDDILWCKNRLHGHLPGGWAKFIADMLRSLRKEHLLSYSKLIASAAVSIDKICLSEPSASTPILTTKSIKCSLRAQSSLSSSPPQLGIY